MGERQMKDLQVPFFWEFTRSFPEDLNLEQNRCENLESHGATEL
jgi:hypothetical protein